jgi:hypothetical protein
MSETHESRQICNSCAIVEDFCGHAISLALIYSTAGSACCDSTGILSTVLEEVEGFVEIDGGGVGSGIGQNEGENTAHGEDEVGECEMPYEKPTAGYDVEVVEEQAGSGSA